MDLQPVPKFLTSLNLVLKNYVDATKNIAEFFRSNWNPKDQDLYAFNARFNTPLYNSVLETNPQFGFD